VITADEYVRSLADGRSVWLEGARVADVVEDPLLAKSVQWVASTYERYAGTQNPMYEVPRSKERLREQISFLLGNDRTASTTAGCMAVTTVGDEVLRGYGADITRRDVRVSAAVEETAQPVQVIADRPDGLVIQGGKQHVVGAAVVHELLVLAGDVAVAVPVNAPGVRIIAHTPAPRPQDDRSYPYSRANTVSEGIVIFDDVSIPSERVFRGAQSYANTLQVWERARAVADQADRAELIMGLAQTISEMNGIDKLPHVRDKLSAIAVYAKMCRAGWDAAVANAKINHGGMVCPDDSYLYATKSYGGYLYSDMIHYLHDVAGGAVITAPSIADLESAETGHYLRKYMRTMEGVRGEDRVRIFHLIRDLFADTYGGWDKVTNQVVGGGIHAQRMAALDAFDIESAKRRAVQAAGISS
jgi:4-hydroxybutyryl-CoA dehydratase / vinylacetyl-CoA-Delta-isomerase